MLKDNKFNLSLRLSTIDCTTSTKYYRLNQKISENQKQKIKQYFKYYTTSDFQDLDNVAGNTTGWMCKDDDVEVVEKLLNIIETRAIKQQQLHETQEKRSVQSVQNIEKTLLMGFSN
ncbi:hypothetical protein [Methanosphaera sp.]